MCTCACVHAWHRFYRARGFLFFAMVEFVNQRRKEENSRFAIGHPIWLVVSSDVKVQLWFMGAPCVSEAFEEPSAVSMAGLYNIPVRNRVFGAYFKSGPVCLLRGALISDLVGVVQD